MLSQRRRNDRADAQHSHNISDRQHLHYRTSHCSVRRVHALFGYASWFLSRHQRTMKATTARRHHHTALGGNNCQIASRSVAVANRGNAWKLVTFILVQTHVLLPTSATCILPLTNETLMAMEESNLPWTSASWMVVVFCLLSTVGCLNSRLQSCGNDLCTLGQVCGPNGQCATISAIEACDGQDDGKSCIAVSGFCQSGVCISGLCGNGELNVGESCDDGNIVSGDGCRQDCAKIEVCGDSFVDTLEQ
jgi:cysteine-rich repeat protein